MAAVEEFLSQTGQEKYREAMKLNDIDSCNDPESDPFRSKYKSREILHELKIQVDQRSNDSSDPTHVDWLLLSAALDMRLGMNYVDCEELSTGEEHLSKCVESLKDRKFDPKCCNIVQIALNQLGILWTGRSQSEKALHFLKQAESLFLDFKKDVSSAPVIADDLFTIESLSDAAELEQKKLNHFEDTYTHTLYYLAQVYGKLDESKKSAEYCHETLRRQLSTMKYDPHDWALNAATLSQYFMTQADFSQGRHCLASACTVLKEKGDIPEKLTVTPLPDETQDDLFEREKFPKAWADVYRCWVKYSLSLLEYSRARLYEKLSEDDKIDEKETDSSDADKKEFIHRFDLDVSAFENVIADKPLLDFEEARQVFLVAQKWANSAKEFYILDGHCTDYVEIIQDHSKLYKELAFFEMDFDRQCKMHKRRVDIIQAVLNELSAQHYLLICRQLMYELAETYSTMLDIKLSIIEMNETAPSAHAAKKINQLATQSIDQYVAYIDTLRDTEKNLPKKYADDDERPAIVAHFCAGRLHSKFIEFEIPKRILCLKNSLDCYQYIVDYCKRNPDSVHKFKSERDICAEMVDLLPTKMDRIRAQVM